MAIDQLEKELRISMDALFLLFGCVAVVIGALLALSTPSPSIFLKIPFLATQVLPRMGQGVVVIFSTIALMRVGLLPGILRRSLAVRHQIAVDEARRKTIENSAGIETKSAFPVHPDFGKSYPIEDFIKKDPH